MEGRSVTSSPRTLLLVGVGNVGAGIAEAFVRRGWQVRGVDPNPALAPTEVRDSVIPCAIDDLPDAELAELLAASDEIVYAAECGNRDEYAVRPDLGQQNNMRFERFACRVVRCSPAGAHIAYVGGSWTRRALSKGGSAVVTDASPAKAAAEANPYEAAKTAAAAAAAALAAQLPGLRLTFYDWASVVPNLAPNFSIAKMAAAALAGEPVRYSAGDFGRPLLGAADAGRALLLATEARLEVAAGASAVAGQGGCEVVLLPGVFVRFERFAQIVNEEVTRCTSIPVTLAAPAEGERTPAALAARCEGSRRLAALGFEPDEAAVEEGLRRTAWAFLKRADLASAEVRYWAARHVAQGYTLPLSVAPPSPSPVARLNRSASQLSSPLVKAMASPALSPTYLRPCTRFSGGR